MALPSDVVQDHILSSMEAKEKFRLAPVCKEWHEYIVNQDDYKHNRVLFDSSSSFTKIHTMKLEAEDIETFKIFGRYWTHIGYDRGTMFSHDYYVYSPEENTFTKQPYPYPSNHAEEIAGYTVFSRGMSNTFSLWREDKQVNQLYTNSDCNLITCKERMLLNDNGKFHDVDLETMILKPYKLVGSKAQWRLDDIITAMDLGDMLLLCTWNNLHGYDLRAGRKIFTSPTCSHFNQPCIYRTKNSRVISLLTDRAYTVDLALPRVQSSRNYLDRINTYNPNYNDHWWRPLNIDTLDNDRYYFDDFYPYRIDLDANEIELDNSILKYPINGNEPAYNLFWEDGLAFSGTFDNCVTGWSNVNVYKLM